MFLIAMVGIGVILLSIGLPNEARIRPYRYYYNCEEYTDIENFTWTDCECEPPEYEVYLGLAVVGAIMAIIGGGLLANLAYHSRHPVEPSPTVIDE